MAELTDEQKHFIVQAHAQFKRSPEIIADMRDEFEVVVSKQQVAQYNPQRKSFDAGDRWRQVFDAYRKAYMEEITSHDIASPAYRIGMLDRMAKKAERMGNIKLAADLAEQAAKEVGGAFTNERKVSGTIDHRHRPATIEDAKAELTERLKAIQQSAAASGQDTTSSGEHGDDVAQRA
jgi:hypothetical protein